jgi:hypothetical protein
MRTSSRFPLPAVVLVLSVCLFAATPAMAEFGLQRLAVGVANQNGTPDLQAGSHPYAITTTFLLNQPAGGEGARPEGDLKDVRLELPPGFVGDPTATPRCNYQEFIKVTEFIKGGEAGCPNETAVGIATTFIGSIHLPPGEETPTNDPVYNLVPPAGVAAEFGFMVAKEVPVFLKVSVRTGEDYGLTVSVPDLSQAVLIEGAKVTIWGVPAEPSHDLVRGECLHQQLQTTRLIEQLREGLREGEDELEGPIGTYEEAAAAGGEVVLVGPTKKSEETGGCPSRAPKLPLLTNPTSCGVPRTATVSVDSWEEPEDFSGTRKGSVSLPELVGCEKLDFSPTIKATPDGTGGSTPTGLDVDLHVPQESTLNPVGLAEADVKNTTVALPEGMQISPGAADGLLACTPAEIGLHTAERPTCPEASKVGTVEVTTPLLPDPLTGYAYLATQDENPFGSLIALYLAFEDPAAGVLVKVAGQVSLDPVTGQVVTTFDETPQFPFNDFKLDFFGTARAPLSTPPLCGTYTTTSSIEPSSGTPAATPSAKFQITSGPNGTPCSDPLPFEPGFEAGTTNVHSRWCSHRVCRRGCRA